MWFIEKPDIKVETTSPTDIALNWLKLETFAINDAVMLANTISDQPLKEEKLANSFNQIFDISPSMYS